MAPRQQQHKPPKGTDNAYSYSVVEKSKERREAEIVISESMPVFHPKVKDNTVTTQSRDLSDQLDDAAARAEALRKQRAELDPVQDEREMAELGKKAEEQEDLSVQKMREIIACLLEDDEGKPPEMAELEKVYIGDLAPLIPLLLRGGEPLTPPTVIEATSA